MDTEKHMLTIYSHIPTPLEARFKMADKFADAIVTPALSAGFLELCYN